MNKCVKNNYYCAVNVPPKKIKFATEKEIAERYSQGYSLKSIVNFIVAKERISEDEARNVCEKTVLHMCTRR